MNKRSIGYAVGKLLQIMGLIMLLPMLIGLLMDFDRMDVGITLSPEILGFNLAIVLCLLFGFALVVGCKHHKSRLGIREGYAVATFGWVILSGMGSLPFFFYTVMNDSNPVFSDYVKYFTDAYFETMSGFTTTGSTIYADIEVLPKGLLFWRSMTHWLGGMGIITLALAIFPAMGVSGYGMYRGEVPGPSKDKLQPRLSETAKILWGVYLVFTIAETILLRLGGMPLFDSICHTFGTLATGGFSTKNQSIGHYDNLYIYWVIILFMFLSGVNYLLHYRALFKKDMRDFLQNHEFVFYCLITVICIVLVFGSLTVKGLQDPEASYQSYRYSKPDFEAFTVRYGIETSKLELPFRRFTEVTFQVVSILTTTGFVTSDFDLWPNFCRFILIVLMFWGSCAGSTGGGIKIIRVMTLLQVSLRELGKLANPRWIAPLLISGQVSSESKVINILALFNLFILIFVVCTAAMMLIIPDFTTAFSSVVATLGNIGPGLNGVGAIENFAWIPVPGKWILIACMLLGRLEIFSVLIVLRPSIWRK